MSDRLLQSVRQHGTPIGYMQKAVCGGQTRGQTPGQTLGKPRANPSPLRANPSFAACPGTGKRWPAWQEQVPVSPSNLPIYNSKRLNDHVWCPRAPRRRPAGCTPNSVWLPTSRILLAPCVATRAPTCGPRRANTRRRHALRAARRAPRAADRTPAPLVAHLAPHTATPAKRKRRGSEAAANRQGSGSEAEAKRKRSGSEAEAKR